MKSPTILPQWLINLHNRFDIWFGWQLKRLHEANHRLISENISIGKANQFLETEVSRLEREKSQLLAFLKTDQIKRFKGQK